MRAIRPCQNPQVEVGQVRRHPATGQTVTVTFVNDTHAVFSPPVAISYAYLWAIETWELIR